MAADEGKYLRVKATYDDKEGDDKVAYVRSEFQVREEVADVANNPPEFDGDAAARDIAEDADVRDAVGNPVVATDANALDGGKLTYTIQTGGDAGSFSIDKRTGQIRVAKALDHEDGATSGNGVYEITVVATDPSGAGRQSRRHRHDSGDHHGHRCGRGTEREGQGHRYRPCYGA